MRTKEEIGMAKHNCDDWIDSWKTDYQQKLRCVCGTEQSPLRPWIPEPEDYKRWKGYLLKFFNILKDGQPHERTEIWERAGRPLNFSAHISQLRDAGGVVPPPTRDGKKIWYQMTGFTDESTLSHGIHYPSCMTCRCTA